MKKCTLDLVNKQHNGIKEIRANIRNFNREAKASSDNSSRARKLLTGTSYWLYDEATDAFGPSKFVGFNSMIFECYDYWVEKAKTRKGKFLGGDTRKANEKTLGTNFAPNPSLAKKLVEWGEKLFVAGIFKGTCQDKWRFIKIPK
ncbi:MAG TPA: hypothetical protein DIU00_18475 [Phycisphaerales bacterium]|nr:hypothetical protein [Phycisphaerales bacterium]